MKPTNPFLRILRLLPFLALAMSLTQCALSDTLASLFVSENDESRIGAQFDAELQGKPSEYPEFVPSTERQRRFAEYVQGVFSKVMANVPSDQKPSYSFKLTIVDQPVVNAFAVPGGYIYLYTGIVESMQSESELAGVLAHEVSHVTHHHYRDAMMKAAGISMVVDALSGEDKSQLKTAVSNIFTQLTQLAVSRDNETEADAFGTRYIGSAGWNPYGISDFFSRMPSQGIAWLSTHPAPGSRVEDVKTLVKEEGFGQNGQTTWDQSEDAKHTQEFLTQKANIRR